MNKLEIAQRFMNAYTTISDSKRDEFARIVNKLLSVNYICAQKERDKDDYYRIVQDVEMYANYFELMDYTLEFHRVEKVINIYNQQNYNRYNFKKNESIILLLLRKIYYVKMQQISLLDNITVTLKELHEQLQITGLFAKRINKTELFEIFRLFRRYNILDYTGTDDEAVIIIYPTIAYMLPIERIDEIENRLKDYKSKGEVYEETDESQDD